MSPTPQSREIRVFLSSTFQDMDAERQCLVKQVFPRVRAACLARQVGFTEIDLRWGVTEEESQNGVTVEICLKEIDRCRDFPPFFIGFLGERYGWIPRHDDLQAYWQRHADSPYAAPIQTAVQRGISVTELEMDLAVLAQGAADKLAGHALFLLRAPALTDQLYQATTGRAPDPSDRRFYDPAQGQIEALKTRIRHSPYLGLDGYPSINAFGQAIANYLLAELDRYFPADQVPSAFEQGNLAHAAFRYHRLQNYLPRPEVRQAVEEALARRADQPHLGPLLLAGSSGQGKSALMADLARHLAEQPGYRIIDHYIGADADNRLEAWVLRLLQTLHPLISDLTGDIPETPKERAESLSTWLAYAATRQNVRYVLLLDALDQLADGGRDLSLLRPEIIGPSATVIASVADGTPAREAAHAFETLEVPPLTAALRSALIAATLARYRKGLAPALADQLAQAPQSGSPLFLTLALEELRLDARHETLAATLQAILAQPDAEHLFLHAFLLDLDNARPEQPDLALRFMALLGAAHAGLTEIELADLLALPTDPQAADTAQPRLPQVHLSRLLTNFQPFLLTKDGRRAPMHRIFGAVALAEAGEVEVREHLYAYFQPGYGQDWGDVAVREASEALYQITQLAANEAAAQPDAREGLLADLGRLRVPAHLYSAAEQVTAAALAALTEAERFQLGEVWQAAIAGFDLEGVKEASEDLHGLGVWLRDQAYDRYRLPRRLIEALLAVQERWLPADDVKLAKTMNGLGLLCHDMGDYPPIRPLYERALAIREQALGPTHPDTAMILNSLASYLDNTGDLADRAAARPLYERALAIFEQALGPTHPDTAMSLDNLAGHLTKTGDPADRAAARSLFERALAIFEQALGPTHPETATSLNNLASYLKESGDPVDRAAARPLYERALAISQQARGPTHPETAAIINNLAGYLKDTGDPGDHAAARPLLELAQNICEQALGPTHPDTAKSLNNLALFLNSTGDPADRKVARPLYERALFIWEQALGPTHPVITNGLMGLAKSLISFGNPADRAVARPLLERALDICEQTLGVSHPDTARCLNNLAFYFNSTGDPADRTAARPLYERALAIREQALGPMHPATANTLDNLANYLDATGDSADRAAARPLYERALAIREQALGSNHLDTAQSYLNLAAYLKESDDPADRMAVPPLYERALAIQEKALGPTHPATAKSLNILANHLNASGDPADRAAARPLYERALAIREQALGSTHLDTAKSLLNLAAYLKESDDLADRMAARPLFERALAIYEERVATDGWQPVMEVLLSLGNLLGTLGEVDEAISLLQRELDLSTQIGGEDDPGTSQRIENLAMLLEDHGRISEVVPLRRQQISILERTLGPDDEETLRTKQNFGVSLRQASRPLEALPLIREVLESRMRRKGDDSLETASALSALGATLQQADNLTAAEEAYRKALDIRMAQLGPDDPATQVVQKRLDALLSGEEVP